MINFSLGQFRDLARLKKLSAVFFAFLLFAFVFLRELIPFQVVDIVFLSVLICFAHRVKYAASGRLIFASMFFFSLSLIISGFFNYLVLEVMDYIRIFTYLFIITILIGLNDYFFINRVVFFYSIKIFLMLTALFSLVLSLALVMFYFGKDMFGLSGLLYARAGAARVSGFFDNPNYFSFSMFFAFLVSVYAVKLNIASRNTLFLIVLGGVISLSRGYVLGVFSFFVIFMALRFLAVSLGDFRVSLREISLRFFIFLAVIASVVLVCAFYAESIFLSDSFEKVVLQRLEDRGGGLSDRFESIANWYEFGVGSAQSLLFGNGGFFFEEYSSANHKAHNSYIRIVGEYGLFSLISFLMFLLAFLGRAIALKRNVSAIDLSALLSLALVIFTNDYYLLREFWLVLFFIYFFSSADLMRGSLGGGNG